MLRPNKLEFKADQKPKTKANIFLPQIDESLSPKKPKITISLSNIVKPKNKLFKAVRGVDYIHQQTVQTVQILQPVKIRTGLIFGLVRDTEIAFCKDEIEIQKINDPIRLRCSRRRKEGSFNTGRWMSEEHQRFIEALLKHGNEWKSVQKYVGTRSSTQARSHAQKFFVKIGKTQIENLSLDFENNSLKSLNLMANNLDSEQMAKAIRTLNKLAFEKKNFGRKNAKGSSTNVSSNYPSCKSGFSSNSEISNNSDVGYVHR